MTNIFKNDKGIALVTSLMLTLIIMTVIMATFYLITAGTIQTGASKRYKTALDASYGGGQMVVKDLIPQLLQNFTAPNMISLVTNNFASAIGLQIQTSSLACLQAKLTQNTSKWQAASCSSSSSSLNPTQMPDFQFSLQSNGQNPYTVYSKIVDTVQGNTDMSGLQLLGGGVAEAQTSVTAQHFPYIYRVEVQAERSTNATEQANLSVVYAY